MKSIYITLTYILLLTLNSYSTHAQDTPPNILLITVDDMNWNSIGAFGNSIKDITPHIDGLAAEGVRFDKAYVAAANCAPSRVAIQTGLYPQQSGARGFYYIDDSSKETIATLLKGAGYITGVLNKSADTNPSPDNDKYWDHRSGFKKVDKYSATAYGAKSAAFYQKAAHAGKPFYHVVNIADPHKPFYNDPISRKKGFDVNVPSRIIQPEEIEVPSFLPDLPGVRKDLLNYYNSVKRADDCVGAVLKALESKGLTEQTLVIFLSDHGMPFPMAKSSVYDNGLHTPLIMQWEGGLEGGQVIDQQIVSVVDLLPTIMEVTGLKLPRDQPYLGQSLLGIMQQKKPSRKTRYAFGNFDENSKGVPNPMRSAISNRWNYVFNAWGTGAERFQSAAMWHLTYKTMKKNAEKNEDIAAMVQHIDYRTVEELYDLTVDSNCRNNLAQDPKYKSDLEQMRAALRDHMVQTNDYLLEAFDVKEDINALNAFMDRQRVESMYRAQNLIWKRATNQAGPAKDNTGLFGGEGLK